MSASLTNFKLVDLPAIHVARLITMSRWPNHVTA